MAIKDSEIFAGYIPVVHQGYIEAFDRNPDLPIGVFDQTMIEMLPYLRKDIRALDPVMAEKCIRGLGREAFILTKDMFEDDHDAHYIMPADDLTDEIEQRYPHITIRREPVFLRWDRTASITNVDVLPDREISMDLTHPIVRTLEAHEGKSSNWWRHIGAVITDTNGEVLLAAHNSPVPTEHTSWIESDPRITASRGDAIDRTLDIHAEAALIAEAARTGSNLHGTELYVSTFPCPNCAKLIAYSGVRSCYFMEGYAMVDGQSILKSAGVEIVKVNIPDQTPPDPRISKPYV